MNSKSLLQEEGLQQEWMITFADLMTLLLVFFILLFSMSSLENEKFSHAMRSLNLALYGSSGANSLIDFAHEAPVKQEVPEEMEEVLPAVNRATIASDQPFEGEQSSQTVAVDAEWRRLTDELAQRFQQANALDAVEIGDPRDGKVTIRVSGSALFPSGSAEFHARMMPMLDGVVRILLNNEQYKVNIQGHTDNIPIETMQFPSNWELSAVRATTVLRYFIRGGVAPERVTATGYGDSLPLAPNDSVANQTRNRRIEFVLEKVE